MTSRVLLLAALVAPSAQDADLETTRLAVRELEVSCRLAISSSIGYPDFCFCPIIICKSELIREMHCGKLSKILSCRTTSTPLCLTLHSTAKASIVNHRSIVIPSKHKKIHDKLYYKGDFIHLMSNLMAQAT